MVRTPSETASLYDLDTKYSTALKVLGRIQKKEIFILAKIKKCFSFFLFKEEIRALAHKKLLMC